MNSRLALTVIVAALVALLTLPPALRAQRLGDRVDSHALNQAGKRRFVQNVGQWAAGDHFVSIFGTGRIVAQRGGVAIVLSDESEVLHSAVHVGLPDAGTPLAVGEPSGTFHFLRAGEGRSRTFVPGFSAIVYEGVCGVAQCRCSVVVEGDSAGAVWTAKRSEMRPGCRIPLVTVTGGQTLAMGAGGEARISTPAGVVTWTAPRVRASHGPKQSWTPGRWERVEGGLGVRVAGAGDLDPEITSVSWSTYFGGVAPEFFTDVTASPDGSIAAGGYSLSSSLPTTEGSLQPTQWNDGEETGMVVRLSADGEELLYATFLGGGAPRVGLGGDEVRAVHAVGASDVLVAGRTGNTQDFPVTPGAFDTEKLSTDGFVARLSGDGSELVFSTFLGGDSPLAPGAGGSTDTVTALDVDSVGNIVVAGTTNSPLFPVTPGSFQTAMSLPVSAANQEGFVAKLSADGTELLHATYLGGGIAEGSTDVDWLRALAVLPDDSVVVVGSTTSVAFPTTPDAFAPSDFAKLDGFVTRLSPDLTSLVFSSYLGGDGEDKPHDVAIHPDGSILVAGEVTSLGSFSLEFDFPITSDAADPIPGGTSDAFLTQIDPSGERILYSTFVGGSGREQLPVALAVDSAGGVTLACTTFSFDAPITPGALLTSKPSGENDHTGMVARYHPTTRSLLHGTYLGGSEWDIGIGGYTLGLLVTPQGDAVLAQGALSEDFPLTELGAIPEYAGLLDGFVSSLTMLPTGVTRFGASTPLGEHALAVGVLAMPAVGADGFGVSCSGAPPADDGYLLLSSAPLPAPQSALGASLWVDPSRLLGLARVRSNALGYSQTRLPIPDLPALTGVVAYAQYLWPTPAPATASAALAISVQP